MFKRLLAFLALAVLLTACTMDAGEGLLEKTFNRGEPLSDNITVDVATGVTEIEFIIEAQFNLGSATVFAHDPQGETYTLALGLTNSKAVVAIENPPPGQWTLEVHVDGNSETVVDGDLRLAMRIEEKSIQHN